MYFLLEFLIFLHRNSLLLIYLKSRSIELLPFVIVCSTKPYSFASALTDFSERCKFTICFLNSSEYLLLLCTICNTSFLIQKFNVSHFMCPLIYTNTTNYILLLLNLAYTYLSLFSIIDNLYIDYSSLSLYFSIRFPCKSFHSTHPLLDLPITIQPALDGFIHTISSCKILSFIFAFLLIDGI